MLINGFVMISCVMWFYLMCSKYLCLYFLNGCDWLYEWFLFIVRGGGDFNIKIVCVWMLWFCVFDFFDNFILYFRMVDSYWDC